MTRNTEDRQYGGDYGYNQQQSYGQGPPQQGGGYGGDYQGGASSYYGSNDQAYQQYPPQGNYQGGPGQQSYPPQHQQQYGYDQQQSYGGGPPAQQYGQQYPPPQHYQQQQYQGGQVDSFRSQFDHPNAPPNAQGYYSQPPPAGQYPPPGAHPAGGPEGDRGLMGALGGAALGGFGGHKMGHGVLGTLGGAVAGSMAEDADKKHNKKDKKDKKHKKPRSRRGSNSSSSSSSSSDSDSSHGKKKHRGVVAGNFHASSNDIRLERNSVLVANCRDVNGHMHHSELNLNDCLTNTNGRIGWARGGNFAASSRNIRLADRGRVLEAELGDGRGSWVHNEIVLSEKIGNDNGRLHMM